jgi:hypothetical protein
VVRKVPKKLKELFGRLAMVILQQLLEACNNPRHDDPHSEVEWRAFLELPSKVLSFDVTRNTKRAKDYMSKVMEAVTTRGLAAYHEVPDFAPSVRRVQVARDAKRQRVERALKLVREGEFGRAVASLMRPGIHPMTDDRVREVAALFPDNPVQSQIVAAAPSVEYFSEKATRLLAKEIKSLHGTCPGPTQWSAEMVKVQWRDANKEAVVELIRRIPTTRGVVREWLLGASVVPAMNRLAHVPSDMSHGGLVQAPHQVRDECHWQGQDRGSVP